MTSRLTFGRTKAQLVAWFKELSSFAGVGAIAFIIDTGIFNLLTHGPGTLLGHKPVTAKIIAGAIATLFAWVGNRYVTFAEHRARSNQWRELLQFIIANVIGLAIASVCLAFSRYILHLDSALADNIAANVVGLGLGTAFRYFAYKFWVFKPAAVEVGQEAASGGAGSAAPPQ